MKLKDHLNCKNVVVCTPEQLEQFKQMLKKKPSDEPKLISSFKPILNYKRDPEDSRDFVFQNKYKTFPNMVEKLPTEIDHTPMMSSVKDQGQLGSCVGFAVAAMKEWQEAAEHKEEVVEGKRDHRKGKEYDLSEAWVYWNAKKIDPWPGEEGTSIRYAMKVLNRIGVPTEKGWPYKDVGDIGEPKAWAKMVAKWAWIAEYWRITTLDELKLALSKSPVPIGIPCFEEIFYVGSDGVVNYPANPNKIYGGHAVCCHPETSITTHQGIKKIIDIEKEDMVLTRKGYKKVNDIFYRKINEEIYSIYNNLSINPLKVTKEHPILVRQCLPKTKISLLDMNKFEFIEAKDIKKGYFVKTFIDDTIVENDITNDFAWILGYYIGDGNLQITYSKNGNIKSIKFRVSYHRKNDRDNIEKLIKYVKEYDDKINYSIYEDKKNKTNTITFYSTSLGKKILNFCGGPFDKNLSSSILYMEKDKQMMFLNGWWCSDGCSGWLEDSNIFTSEENLAEQLIFILQRNRLVYRFNKRAKGSIKIWGKKYNTKEGYQIYFHTKHKKSRLYYDGNFIYTRIKDVYKESYEGFVYNFEVDDVHEYIANNIITHNCAVSYDDEKQLVKFKNSWSKYWGDDGYGYIPYTYVRDFLWDAWTCVDIRVRKTMLKETKSLFG